MDSIFSRRTVLSTGLLFFSGCSVDLPIIEDSDPNEADIFVTNQSEVDVEYDLMVRNSDEPRVLIDESVQLDSEEEVENDGNSKLYPNLITESGSYYLKIRTSTGYGLDYKWDEITEPTKRQGDSDGLHINIYDDAPILLEANERK